jgi:hypothetical protein
MKDALFATAYLPTLEYVLLLLNYDNIIIDLHEHYRQQSNRNRCHILGPNGIQALTIPIQQTHVKTPTGNIQIAEGRWRIQHWRSLEAAYNRSPLFEYYRDEFYSLYFSNTINLIAFNTSLLHFILKIIKSNSSIQFSTEYHPSHNHDYRFLSNSKDNQLCTNISLPEYPQVHGYKHGFIANLSIVDALFNGYKI